MSVHENNFLLLKTIFTLPEQDSLCPFGWLRKLGKDNSRHARLEK